eukprot:9909921-Ditylum_brightwellii.AAC.1
MKETIDMTKMTNDPSTPVADPAKKRRIFSPDRSMEDVHSPRNSSLRTTRKGKEKEKSPTIKKKLISPSRNLLVRRSPLKTTRMSRPILTTRYLKPWLN